MADDHEPQPEWTNKPDDHDEPYAAYLHSVSDVTLVMLISKHLSPPLISVALGREVDRRLKSLHMRMAILSDVSKLLEE